MASPDCAFYALLANESLPQDFLPAGHIGPLSQGHSIERPEPYPWTHVQSAMRPFPRNTAEWSVLLGRAGKAFRMPGQAILNDALVAVLRAFGHQWQHYWNEYYSYLSAAIGSTRVARRAGR